MAWDTNKNGYTVIFATLLVVGVGTLLSVAAISLKPFQRENADLEKMQSILRAIRVQVDRSDAAESYREYIEQALVLDDSGNAVENPKTPAFHIDLATEIKKPLAAQGLPIFKAEKDGQTYYIIPLYGHGLWGPIWGYISLYSDLNTVYGITFDHASETPGLGAEITQPYFQNQYQSEKIFDEGGKFRGITAVKGYKDPNRDEKDDGRVDTISGATITSNGVTAMIYDRLQLYLPYFKKLKMRNHG